MFPETYFNFIRIDRSRVWWFTCLRKSFYIRFIRESHPRWIETILAVNSVFVSWVRHASSKVAFFLAAYDKDPSARLGCHLIIMGWFLQIVMWSRLAKMYPKSVTHRGLFLSLAAIFLWLSKKVFIMSLMAGVIWRHIAYSNSFFIMIIKFKKNFTRDL